MTVQAQSEAPRAKLRLSYATVWRWHFYAGLFCLPFILWLAITGPIYLFKPQIDAWADRAYDRLEMTGPPALPSAQVKAAVAAVPESAFNAYELPQAQDGAMRVLVRRRAELFRVYVNPQSLQILNVTPEGSRLTRMLFYLHGELMMGTAGSNLVELAASWAIVMIVTGIYLWWPRAGAGPGGLLYPRLNLPDRAWWKDLHSVVGFWVAVFTLFLLITGLPWAASWGTMFKAARQIGSSVAVQQDWTTGSAGEKAALLAQGGEHATHDHAAHQHGGGEWGSRRAGVSLTPEQFDQFDRIVPKAAALNLAYPALISAPSKTNPSWTARSDAQKRPLRETLRFNALGEMVSDEKFADRPFLDRLIGYGVAIHEGQMFGWFNQALGVFTGLGLFAVAISGFVMWIKRRPWARSARPHAPSRGVRVSDSWRQLRCLACCCRSWGSPFSSCSPSTAGCSRASPRSHASWALKRLEHGLGPQSQKDGKWKTFRSPRSACFFKLAPSARRS